MPAPSETVYKPDQQQLRLNYREKKFRDGMIRERSWETPEGTKISERVNRRGHTEFTYGEGDHVWRNKNLITEVKRIEQKRGESDQLIQFVGFFEQRPLGVIGGSKYEPTAGYRNDEYPNLFLVLKGYTVNGRNLNNRRVRDVRSYHRYLWPLGEEARFYDEQGRPILKEAAYMETENGWKKTARTREIDPINPGDATYQFPELRREEELLRSGQLPPHLPKAEQPNGFRSLDDITEEYYKLPPF